MAEPERVNRPGDQSRVLGPEHDECVAKMNRLTQERNEARDQPPSMYERAYWEVQHVLSEALGTERQDGAGLGLAADVELLAKQRDAAIVEIARLRDEAANALANQAKLKGLSVEEGAAVLELAPPRELVIAWVDAARKMLGDAENYAETRIDFPAVSAEIKAAGEIERYVFTVQRAGKLTPHEARKQAEAALEGLRSQVAELTRERDEALQRVEAAASSEPSLAWLFGWESALNEVDAWAQRHAEHAQQHGDLAAEQAYAWCSTFALATRNDPAAPGRLADRVDLRPGFAQEAGEPAELASLPAEVRGLVHAVDRMRDRWAEADERTRAELWSAIHQACDAVWSREGAGEPDRLSQELAEQLREDHLAECDGSSGCQAMSHLDGCYRSLPEGEPQRLREWQKGDPEPEDRPKVRDCHGDVWAFVGFGRDGLPSWTTPETMPCTWEHIARKWSPLTEVLPEPPVDLGSMAVSGGLQDEPTEGGDS